jgi:hypothetical protein
MEDDFFPVDAGSLIFISLVAQTMDLLVAHTVSCVPDPSRGTPFFESSVDFCSYRRRSSLDRIVPSASRIA